MLEKRGGKEKRLVNPNCSSHSHISAEHFLSANPFPLLPLAPSPNPAGRQANPSPAQLGAPVQLKEGTHLLHAADPSPTRQDTPKPLLHSPA